MTAYSLIKKIFLQEDVNFLLTNRIPRQLLTRFMGWFSRIETPLIRDFSIAVWQRIADLRLDEAKKTQFTSLHDCFIRELKPGLRPIDRDPGLLVSPCDAIVGASGTLTGETLIQAKGFPYTLTDLLGTAGWIETFRGGTYVTLRITSSMYHRFHSPYDCRVERVTYFSGDTWNVNPIALKRVEKLFCKNERAAILVRLSGSGLPVVLVPVAAVLVASISLPFINTLLHLGYRGPNVIDCDSTFRKGDEMGWFQHGSTIIVIAPRGLSLHPRLQENSTVRVGEPLMRLI